MKLLSLGEFLKEDYLIRLLNAWVLGEGVSRAVQGWTAISGSGEGQSGTAKL